MLGLVFGIISCRSPYDLDPPGSRHINGPAPREPEYSWGFANWSDHDIHNVNISWRSGTDTFAAGAGYLSHGKDGWATDNEGWDPIPNEVTLHWTDNWKDRSVVLEVASDIPDIAHFSGTILFIFDGSKWHMQLKKENQILKSWIEDRMKGT